MCLTSDECPLACEVKGQGGPGFRTYLEPAPRIWTNFCRASNQNGAPNKVAIAVISHPANAYSQFRFPQSSANFPLSHPYGKPICSNSFRASVAVNPLGGAAIALIIIG